MAGHQNVSPAMPAIDTLFAVKDVKWKAWIWLWLASNWVFQSERCVILVILMCGSRWLKLSTQA